MEMALEDLRKVQKWLWCPTLESDSFAVRFMSAVVGEKEVEMLLKFSSTVIVFFFEIVLVHREFKCHF